jgi:hypothetical protein
LEKILEENATTEDVTMPHTKIEELEALIKKYPNIGSRYRNMRTNL